MSQEWDGIEEFRADIQNGSCILFLNDYENKVCEWLAETLRSIKLKSHAALQLLYNDFASYKV